MEYKTPVVITGGTIYEQIEKIEEEIKELKEAMAGHNPDIEQVYFEALDVKTAAANLPEMLVIPEHIYLKWVDKMLNKKYNYKEWK